MIRHHFINGVERLCLQAVGKSVSQVTHVACLAQLKGYGTFERIKNDVLKMPVIDRNTLQYLGEAPKVRLTIKIRRSADFVEKIAVECGADLEQYSESEAKAKGLVLQTD